MEKVFVITEEQRSQILKFIISSSYNSARNMLNQLPILEDYLKLNKNKKED